MRKAGEGAQPRLYIFRRQAKRLRRRKGAFRILRILRPAPSAEPHAALAERCEAIHEASRGIYGAPRIQAELADDHAICVGKKRVARLMRDLGIQGVAAKRRPKGKPSGMEAPAAPDLVRRKFTATAPDQLWVADITYVSTWSGWVYVAFVIDAYARRIIGWRCGSSMSTQLVLDALEQAVWTREREGRSLESVVAHTCLLYTSPSPRDRTRSRMPSSS